LKSERIKHLTIAILTDPAHAAAHGLLGMVKFRERWQTPAEIRDKLQEDDAHSAALAEYAVRRARMGNKPTYEDNIHFISSSCFAAGTPVETLTGPRAIESVQIGDQVLSQDPGSGALMKLMQGQSFFVGQQALLVHDNSAVEPVPQPFDLAPAFAGDSGHP
jgi:hypothetical protein